MKVTVMVTKHKVRVSAYIKPVPVHYQHHDKPRPRNYRGKNY